MNGKDKEVIRRLLKGDYIIEESHNGRYSYVIGHGGKCPLAVSNTLFYSLYNLELLEKLYGDIEQCDFTFEHQYETRYKVESRYGWEEGYLEKILKNPYTIGDTVTCVKNLKFPKQKTFLKSKGVITEEKSPLSIRFNLNGISNVTYSSDSIVGTSRVVLVEKKFKNRVVYMGAKYYNTR